MNKRDVVFKLNSVVKNVIKSNEDEIENILSLLIVDFLEEISKSTKNKLDDKAVSIIKMSLLLK
jgi:hypothetical protein